MQFFIKNISELSKVSEYIKTGIKNIYINNLPCLIALDGALGSGKTAFIKNFFKTLGLQQNINSPTFGKVHEYRTDEFNLYHLDMYREALNECELEEIFYDNKGIICIEWFSELKKRESLSTLRPHFFLQFEIISEKERMIHVEVFSN